MSFTILGRITEIRTIAIGSRIRDIRRIRDSYGDGRWRKLKGTAVVLLRNGNTRRAEVHWYEAQGIGLREIKIKRFLD